MTQTNDLGRDAGRSGNRACMQRYRARHKRIDYAPSPEALAIIEAWRAQKLDNCIAGVIDRLIRAGHAALAGHAAPSGLGSMPPTQQVISGKVAPP